MNTTYVGRMATAIACMPPTLRGECHPRRCAHTHRRAWRFVQSSKWGLSCAHDSPLLMFRCCLLCLDQLLSMNIHYHFICGLWNLLRYLFIFSYVRWSWFFRVFIVPIIISRWATFIIWWLFRIWFLFIVFLLFFVILLVLSITFIWCRPSFFFT